MVKNTISHQLKNFRLLYEWVTAYFFKSCNNHRKVESIRKSREFPGGLVVRIWHFHHSGPSSVFGLGTKIKHQTTVHWIKLS